MHIMRSGHARRTATVALLVIATRLVIAARGGGSKAAASPAASSPLSMIRSLPGVDLQSSWDVGALINASDVSSLGLAWSAPITARAAFVAYTTSPVVANRVLHTQDVDTSDAISGGDYGD